MSKCRATLSESFFYSLYNSGFKTNVKLQRMITGNELCYKRAFILLKGLRWQNQSRKPSSMWYFSILYFFSICFRFAEDIIDGANSCKNNMFSLLKAVHLSFRYGVDGLFRRRQNELCITGSFNVYPMND